MKLCVTIPCQAQRDPLLPSQAGTGSDGLCLFLILTHTEACGRPVSVGDTCWAVEIMAGPLPSPHFLHTGSALCRALLRLCMELLSHPHVPGCEDWSFHSSPLLISPLPLLI